MCEGRHCLPGWWVRQPAAGCYLGVPPGARGDGKSSFPLNKGHQTSYDIVLSFDIILLRKKTDEGIHRAGSGRVPGSVASVPQQETPSSFSVQSF